MSFRQYLVEEKANIDERPSASPRAEAKNGEDRIVVVPDLHANALKLVYCLLREGVLTLAGDEVAQSAQYLKLVQIYNRCFEETETADDFKQWDAILSAAKVPEVCPTILLLGDEFSDRGAHDALVLLTTNVLTKKKIVYKALESNHTLELVDAFEQNRKFDFDGDGGMPSDQVQSRYRLQNSIERGTITRVEVAELYQQHKNNFILLTCIESKNQDDEGALSLGAHAIIDMRFIEALAEKFKVPFPSKVTKKNLIETCQKINIAFMYRVQSNSLFDLINRDTLMLWSSINQGAAVDAVLEGALWNRFPVKDRLKTLSDKTRVNWIHGHTASQGEADNVIGLDDKNVLGKYRNYHQATYTILSMPHAILHYPQLEHEKRLAFLMGSSTKSGNKSGLSSSVSGLFSAPHYDKSVVKLIFDLAQDAPLTEPLPRQKPMGK